MIKAGPRKSKYGAIPTTVDGVRFASKSEAKRDAELRLLLRSGEISHLKRQPRFPLVVNGVPICTYVADWRYTESRVTSTRLHSHMTKIDVVEDRKGVQTPAFKIKWALAKALFPEIEWRLS